jgi:hypothetical protein
MTRALTRPLLGALAFLAAGRSLDAQQISGTLRRSLDSLPVASALVVLSDSAGHDVARSVSSERGAFGFAVHQRGAFQLRVLRIGMRPFGPRRVSVPASGRTSVDLYLRDVPIELPTITVATDRRRCGNPPDTTVLGILLLEARKALALTDATLAERQQLFVVETWRRRQSPNLRTIDSIPTVSMDRGWPIRSAPPESLRVWGFVREEPDTAGHASTVYYGPDARVLFADWFLDSHCLRLGRAPAPGQLSLEFHPERPTPNVDIEGRFVIDSASLALRELSWRWILLPSWVPEEGQGGFVRFQQMASGGWLPVAWSLRAPVNVFDRSAGRQLHEYVEFGGRVAEQADGAGAGALAARRAFTSAIEGVVSDTAGSPIADARVSARPSGVSVLTGSGGRFRLDALRPGTSILHAQTVGYAPADFPVRVGPDSTLRVAIQLTVLPPMLDTVVVATSVENTELQTVGFYERMRERQRGAGTSSFVTPEQIERHRPQKVTDLLAQLPGVHVLNEQGVLVAFGRRFGCAMTIWVDGARVKSSSRQRIGGFPDDFKLDIPGGIDGYLSVNQVAAIEVYQTPSEVPAEFNTVDNECGTIVIWTGSRR